MNDLAIGLGSALWLGIMTSVSPCPLATNIAALSYLSRTILHVRLVLLASLAYTIGRMIAYALVGFLVIASLLGIPAIAHFLQHHMNKVLGPVLIIAGMVLLNIIRPSVPGFLPAQAKQGQKHFYEKLLLWEWKYPEPGPYPVWQRPPANPLREPVPFP